MIRTIVRVYTCVTLCFLAASSALSAQATATRDSQTTKPAVDVSGVIFGNYQYRADSVARAQTGGKNPNQFTIDRVYLTFRAAVGERASIRATTDIFQNASAGWGVRLKYGYLQYELARNVAGISGVNVLGRIGMLHTVVIEHEETFWPRYLGNVGVDRFGFFSSADLGAATQVVLPGTLGEIYATVTNGPGFASAETDRFKDAAARLTITPFGARPGWLRTFAISPWIYRGATASRYAAGGPGQVGPVTDGVRRDRWGVFAGVRDPRLTLGAHYARRTEGFEPANANTPTVPRTVSDSTGDLLSLHGVARPVSWKWGTNTSRLGVVLRWDRFRPRTALDGSHRLLVAGLQWEPTSKTALALDYQELTPQGYSAAATPADMRITPTKTWFLHWSASF